MIDGDLRRQLELIALTRGYRRRLPTITRLPRHQTVIDMNTLIAAILLIEMNERPTPVRWFEWILSALVPQPVRRPITRGPLQIANGPWNLDSAVKLAHETLLPSVLNATGVETAIDGAAATWNGKSVRQPCSRYGYGEVLAEAYLIAGQALRMSNHGPERNAAAGRQPSQVTHSLPTSDQTRRA